MSLDTETAQELIRQLRADRETLLKTTELLLQAISTSNDISASQREQAHSHRLTADTLRRNAVTAVRDVESTHGTSAFSGDDGDSDTTADDGVSLFASEPLQAEEYSIKGLREHIRDYPWTDADRAVLRGVIDNETLLNRPAIAHVRGNETLLRRDSLFHMDTDMADNRVGGWGRRRSRVVVGEGANDIASARGNGALPDRDSLFPTDADTSDDRSHLTAYSIHDVADDGTLSEPISHAGGVSRSLQIWERLRLTNADVDDAKKAVGRLTIVREPSPLLFAALHYTMNKHFDMDEIFGFLVDDDPKLVRAHDPFSEDGRHGRSMVWNAEYFTIIGKGCIPMSWQRSDAGASDEDKNHIPISRCSAAVALSFEGPPSGRVKSKDRRLTNRRGDVYDPFSPWRVLVIQCFPDWISTLEDDEYLSRHKPVNGPEAFLSILRQELGDAAKRLLKVHRSVEDLVQPPPDFILSRQTRDRMLFEDESYTLSRRYFWASQTLHIMNQDIEEMIESYQETFNDAFWSGTDKIIWPGTSDGESSSRNAHWRKRMALLRRGIEEEIGRLRAIEGMNEKEIRKITNLREELFSGTSVQESRKSVELAEVTVTQGHNIRILTLVTIFFTPAMCVAGFYGMTNMNPTEGFGHFAIALTLICLPTYLLIIHVNTTAGVRWWSTVTTTLSHSFYTTFAHLTHRLTGTRPSWTAKYLDSAPTDPNTMPLPPGRQRHGRTFSSTSMNMALRTRPALATTMPPVSGPSISRTMTLERTTTNANTNANGDAIVPSTPLSPGVKFNLDEFVIPEQAMESAEEVNGVEEVASGRRKGPDNYTVERTADVRDEEEPFPPVTRVETPGKSLLGRLRRR